MYLTRVTKPVVLLLFLATLVFVTGLCYYRFTMAHNLDEVKALKGLKIVHINSRSLINHFDELQTSFLDRVFDIVVFTESWLHDNCSDSLIKARGYSLYRLDRKDLGPTGSVKRGGGIAIYVKDEFNVVTWSHLNVSDKNTEALSLSCKLGNHKRLNVTAVYRPPGGNVQSTLDKVETIVTLIRQSTSGDTIVIGDLNIDVLSDNAYSKKISQFANTCRIEQLIKDPTRITNKSVSLIDHLYTNSSHCSMSGTLNFNITDHLPVFCALKKSRSALQHREVVGRSFRGFDEAAFRSDILTIDLGEVFADSDPDTIWGKMHNHIVHNRHPLSDADYKNNDW